MSEDSKGSNGVPAQTANGVSSDSANQETQSADQATAKDTVAYETYKKTLSLAKKREAELEQERAEKQKLIEEKLAAEGKKDELIESFKKKLSDMESKHKKAVGSFAYKSLAQAIESEASKAGCINVRDLIQLSDLSNIDMDDDFNANNEQIKNLVESAKKERPYLFNKAVPTAKTGIPQNLNGADLSPDWTKLPLKEQTKLALSLMNKK